MAEKETIVTKMYDLVKYLLPVVNRFSGDYKFTLGDRISNRVLDLLERYIEAYSTGNVKVTNMLRPEETAVSDCR